MSKDIFYPDAEYMDYHSGVKIPKLACLKPGVGDHNNSLRSLARNISDERSIRGVPSTGHRCYLKV
ncbi:hypothetical protein BTJ68_06982 [Hortaea werneckii EXF-2000]|uniref:Uncharacterized protein n=2 Tax=Hortaea werneckii TaxID=91943 RepID=A0A3M7I415_HORWE|nr:hypothetical protein BTJ68_06982 [Hortaea werneckii EXF-2000]RMZ20291.1 hypothetical protein D0859_15711 [Hortaea werneckii]